MNQRELVKSLTTGLVAAGISTDAVAIQPLEAPVDQKGTLVVLRVKGRASADMSAIMQEYWKRATRDTDWQNVRVIVLDDGISMEIHQYRP